MATKDEVSLEESFEREECSEATEDTDKDIQDSDKDTQDTDKDTQNIDKDTQVSQDQDNIGLTVQTEIPDQNSNQPNDEEKGKVTTLQDLNIQEDQADSVETLKILFADSLLKYIDKRTGRGKTNFKWDGEPTQLKDFINLILKRNGQGKTRKAGAGKQMFIFQDKSANLTMNFWQSSKTLTVQGNEDMTAKIEEQLDNPVNSMNPENAETQSKNTKKLTMQQSVAKTTTNGEAPVSTSVDRADSGKEMLSLWEAINEINSLISFQKTNINPINHEAATEKDTVVTERIKQLGNENVKLTDELEQVKALNIELLKLINSQSRGEAELELLNANKKLEAELGQVRLLTNLSSL